MEHLSLNPKATGLFAGESHPALNQNSTHMKSIFSFFLQIIVLLIGIIATTQVLATNNPYFNTLKSKLFRVAEADAFVESVWLPARGNYLISSGNSPGWVACLPIFFQIQKFK